MIPGKPIVTTDYTRYFKRFGSSLECGFNACKDMNYREHFHCAVPMCKGKDFAKKEEMIRHSKWHQKMDEALKYGFRRVTPMDDCSDQFADCTHNKKQTHYHCIQSDGCDKVEQKYCPSLKNIFCNPKIFSRSTSAPPMSRCTSTTIARTTPSRGRDSSGSAARRIAGRSTACTETRRQHTSTATDPRASSPSRTKPIWVGCIVVSPKIFIH